MRVLQIAPGVQATAGSASALVAIPDDSAGNRAKLVYINVLTASEAVALRPVVNAGTATTANGVIVIDSTPTLIWVGGATHLAHIRARTSDCVFNITPVENY